MVKGLEEISVEKRFLNRLKLANQAMTTITVRISIAIGAKIRIKRQQLATGMTILLSEKQLRRILKLRSIISDRGCVL